MHRTEKEIEKQGIASAFLLGGNLHYTKNGFHIGATGICYSYSLPLHPNKSQLYKRFAPEGKNFWNASIDYGYISHRLTLQGEVATGDCGVVATVNTASYLLSEQFSVLALYRFILIVIMQYTVIAIVLAAACRMKVAAMWDCDGRLLLNGYVIFMGMWLILPGRNIE